MIPSWYPPDGGFFFREHCEALASAGVRVEILVNRVISIRRLGRVRMDQLKKFHDSREGGIRVLRSWMFKIPRNEEWNAGRWIRSTVRLYNRYCKSFGAPDIILAHSAIWAGYAAYRISLTTGIPYVITEHRSLFVFSTEAAKNMLRPFYIPLLKEAYLNARQLIIVSDSMKTGLLDMEPRLVSHIREIPEMVNGDFFTPPTKARTADPFVFITAGRLLHVKGLDVLIRAFAKLIEAGHSDIILKVLGRGEERQGLEKLARDLGLTDKVIFTGRLSREEVRDEFQRSDCFVLSSRYEAFGIVLTEAMATGLPVIATRSGGPEKIVQPEFGYLVDTEDEESLAEAMQKMKQKYSDFDPGLIRKTVLDRYGHALIAGQYKELLEELSNPSGEGR